MIPQQERLILAHGFGGWEGHSGAAQFMALAGAGVVVVGRGDIAEAVHNILNQKAQSEARSGYR